MSGFWDGRSVLVTGGNGFIGSHLVERLVQVGARVTTTASREETRWRFLEAVRQQVEVLVGDLRDLAHARRAVREQDVVFHLAARVGGIAYNITHPGSVFRENLEPFLSTMEAARLERIGRFIVTSSACVYPRLCTIPTPESEGFQGWPEPTNEGYGWAKRMEEFVGASYAKEYGLEVRIARLYNAYGPRDNFHEASSHVIPALIRRVLSAENPLTVWGDGTASRSFLYVADAVRGLMAVAEHSPQVEAINIGNEEETTVRQLAERIVSICSTSTRLVFDASRPAGQPRRKGDTALARRLLQFETETQLADGLAKTIAWYKLHHQPVEVKTV